MLLLCASLTYSRVAALRVTHLLACCCFVPHSPVAAMRTTPACVPLRRGLPVAARWLAVLKLHALRSAGLLLGRAWPTCEFVALGWPGAARPVPRWPTCGCAVPGCPGAARATLRWPAAGPCLTDLMIRRARLTPSYSSYAPFLADLYVYTSHMVHASLACCCFVHRPPAAARDACLCVLRSPVSPMGPHALPTWYIAALGLPGTLCPPPVASSLPRVSGPPEHIYVSGH